MNGNAPHFVLFSEASRCGGHRGGEAAEGWRFVLQTAHGENRFIASDMEPETGAERLELLAVVRGLEALDQPSRVTLVTRSRYVSRGIRAGLPAWRESGWQWERFGKMVPVKNRDLWQRIDQAMKFHRVECRRWRVDAPHRPKGQDSAGQTAQPSSRLRRPHAGAVQATTDGDCRRHSGVPRGVSGPRRARSSRARRMGGYSGRIALTWRHLAERIASWLPATLDSPSAET